MEEHKFKLCFKSLQNGRALGSHIKSDMLSLQQSESASYSSSEGEEKGQFYGHREDPKRSETEWSESSKNPTRRRSKRTWRTLEQQEETKRLKANNKQASQTESWGAEPELLSSISDVAFCLMMLSRDQWKSKVNQHDYLDDDEETDESEFTTTLARGKYRCETCNKLFNSYQALGGHRASHKRIKAYETDQLAPKIVSTCSLSRKKTRSHECPVCFRVFSSGQALGGHKRSHITSTQVAATTQTCVKSSKMLVLNLIDLNLPAPVDEK